jgi:hypothetical protein
MKPLLTPEEVAGLLQLSVRTIYANARLLGGFYPAGIRALRFRRETIHAIMEGPQNRQVEIPVSTSGTAFQQNRVQDKSGGTKRPGGLSQESNQPGDPSITADAIRFGLRDPEPGRANGEISPSGSEKLGADHAKIP